jgi:putative tricarboxylic transport membrane protein
VLLALAGWLYVLAGRIEYAGPADRIGPDFWPRAILALLALTCAYELAKRLFFGEARSVDGVLQTLMHEAAGTIEPPSELMRPSATRLAWGVGATLGYALLVDVLGFFLATAAFLAAFILIGGYRRPVLAGAIGVGGSLVMVAIFMKVVYVSLPLGWRPFRPVSLALMALLGVR